MEHPRSALRKKLEQQAMPLIRAWNGQSKIESVGASIYHSWMKYIGRGAIIDELGESDFCVLHVLPIIAIFINGFLTNADSIWWDDLRTPEIKESREDILFVPTLWPLLRLMNDLVTRLITGGGAGYTLLNISIS